MSKKPVSRLRQRLIDDMTARRFSEDTKRDYVRHVRKFAIFLGRSPGTATSEDLRRFQLWEKAFLTGLSCNLCQQPLRLGDLGHFRGRREAFERRREDGVATPNSLPTEWSMPLRSLRGQSE